MEETKLTVRISRDLLKNAKQYAADHNTTLTKLIEVYFRRFPTHSTLKNAPIVEGLIGSMPPDITIQDYKDHLIEKYGA